MTFKNIKAGDRVRFMVHSGMRIVNGKACPEYRPTVGRAQLLLTFPTHVVVNIGRGRAAVVDANNYISHSSKVRP